MKHAGIWQGQNSRMFCHTDVLYWLEALKRQDSMA